MYIYIGIYIRNVQSFNLKYRNFISLGKRTNYGQNCLCEFTLNNYSENEYEVICLIIRVDSRLGVHFSF
jgi:hypothetical protein